MVRRSTLTFALLLLSYAAAASVIMRRREIATTLQQRHGADLVDAQKQQNETQQSTKLLPLRQIEDEDDRSFVNGISKKTTLKLINEPTENDGGDDESPSATSAVPNTIEAQEQQLKEEKLKVHKSLLTTEATLMLNNDETNIVEHSSSSSTTTAATLLEHKSSYEQDSSTSKIPLRRQQTTTEAALTPPNHNELKTVEQSTTTTTAKALLERNTEEATIMPTTSTTTTEPLLEHKSPLSLEDSNDIQLPSSTPPTATPSPKQPKFLNDNSTNFNRLHLPNTADAWTLAGMKTISTRMNESNLSTPFDQQQPDSTSASAGPSNSPVKEKTLTDWTQIVKMGADKTVENSLTEDTTTAPESDIKSTTKPVNNSHHQQHQSDGGGALLSAIDNVDSRTKTILKSNANETQYSGGGEAAAATTSLDANKEKFLSNEEQHEASEKSVLEDSATMSDAQRERNATTPMPTTSAMTTATTTTMKMTTISTPATGLASTVTANTLDESVSVSPASSEIEQIQTTISAAAAATIKPIEIAPANSSIILPTNVTEVINYTTTATTARQTPSPPPDIRQISTAESNLETPTKVIETKKAAEATVQSVNSSAIATQTSNDDVTNSTTESLLNENILNTTSKAITETSVVKETTSENHHQQQLSTTTTNAPKEGGTTTTTTSAPETQTELHPSSSGKVANNTEMSISAFPTNNESTSTEKPLTNFIDDSTTTTTTTSTTTPNTETSSATATSSSAPNSTTSTQISSTPTLTTPTTTTSTTLATPTDDLHSIDIETTPLISEESVESSTATTTSTTSTTTAKELPTFIPPKATTTTTEKTVEMLPTIPSEAPISTTLRPLTFPDVVDMSILHAQPPLTTKSSPDSPETDVNVVIAISVSVIGVIALILLVAFLYLMRKRAKATSYGQRCRPVSLDAYSLDNVSVLGSVRRKSALRASKRSYGNAAFDDPALRHNILQTAADLAKFVERRSSIFEEFRDVPQIIARPEEIPEGCENKNRYANVIPLPETRVILQRRNDDDTTEYINANYVRGPKDAPNYYIACQAPMESTVQDFWRMIWEQQSRVIIQATDLIENGVEKCAEYLPPSVTLDNHTTFGDFQVTLKHREVKDKYAISTIMLKDTNSNTSREITHYWYKWPEIGVPTEEAPIIAMLLEVRSSLKSYALEVTNELKEKSSLDVENDSDRNGFEGAKAPLRNAGAGTSNREINGNITDKSKMILRNQGPLTIHCSPGTGRTGTIIACDLAIRSLETTKSIDIPQIVYYIRRGRASAIQTKEQYEFIYKVANVYAMKITNDDVPNDN